MKYPRVEKFDESGPTRIEAMQSLEEAINNELHNFFSLSKDNGDDYLAKGLIGKVESLVEKLNDCNYDLGRIEYSGDVSYENSEQWYGNGETMGTGLILHFHGYHCDVSWCDTIEPCDRDA